MTDVTTRLEDELVKIIRGSTRHTKVRTGVSNKGYGLTRKILYPVLYGEITSFRRSLKDEVSKVGKFSSNRMFRDVLDPGG